MNFSMKSSYEDLKSVIHLTESGKQNDQIFTIKVNDFFDKIRFFDKKPKFPITIRLILPKTIIFNPLQNDHIVLNFYDPAEEYILSWKLECLILPCQGQNIEVEIIY